MIADHLVAMEQRLLAQAGGPARASQLFAGDFCTAMFGDELRIVSPGQVVDSSWTPATQPAAADLLLCLPQGPRLRQPGQPDVLTAESVVAAISVVPSLDADTMAGAVAAARLIKGLRRHGLHPAAAGPIDGRSEPLAAGLSDAARAIPCHLVAFGGPPQIGEVHHWLKLAYRQQGISEAEMPPTGAERQQIASPALDGVFVLGSGYLGFDNSPIGFFDDQARRDCFGACWAIVSTTGGSLLALFLQLQLAAHAMAGTRLDPRPYLTGPASKVDGVRLGN